MRQRLKGGMDGWVGDGEEMGWWGARVSQGGENELDLFFRTVRRSVRMVRNK